MDAKTEAKRRVDAASVACDKSLESWKKAVSALGDNVSVNGFGIIRDRSAFRQKLREANASIAASLAELDAVTEWPSNADYDQL